MKELITFEHSELGEIKGLVKDNEPWFVASHVCKILGIKNSRDAVRTIRERYRVAGIKGVGDSYILLDTKGGKQKTNIIPEQFLYELIFQSRKQKAIRFRAWVTSEVLPAIRKQGFYRHEGKLIRRNLTDNIQKSVKNKSENTKKFAYSNYSRLINKSLGLPSKVNRDTLDAETLEKIAHRENLVSALLLEGQEYGEIKQAIEGLKGGEDVG